jgi:hypothetical protein
VTEVGPARETSNSNKELEKHVSEGLDFILYHLQEPLWPRTISTRTTERRQIPVYGKQEALAWYKAANFLDCRISAYPCDHGGKISDRQTIDLVMLDFDLFDFRSRVELDRALHKTLSKIKETFGNEFEPSIIWSGNGYHVYVPIRAIYVLEERSGFSKFLEPSKQFLRFAESYFSNGKSDQAHNTTVTFKNCMLRIPGSHNSKCMLNGKNPGVKIIPSWDGSRPGISLLLGSFYVRLIDQEINGIRQARKNKKNNSLSRISSNTQVIRWIETLLQNPIKDHRKFSIW